mgnify:CR=1 FL=1
MNPLFVDVIEQFKYGKSISIHQIFVRKGKNDNSNDPGEKGKVFHNNNLRLKNSADIRTNYRHSSGEVNQVKSYTLLENICETNPNLYELLPNY